MSSFYEDEFRILCQFTHRSDTAVHGLERAVVLGYPTEKLHCPDAIINAIRIEQIGMEV